MRAVAAVAGAVVVLSLGNAAHAQPALDDFYERTRDRETPFGERDWFAHLVLGLATGNPATDTMRPQTASGVRVGIDAGVRDDRDVVRTDLSAEALAVHETRKAVGNLTWHLTGFKAYGRPHDDQGTHLSLDSVVTRHAELTPGDIAHLQRAAYSMVDVEGEIAPIGPPTDKDANLALPIGVASRLRWADGGGFDIKTDASMALAARALFHDLGHAQLDFLRVKRTQWDTPTGGASAWTVSAGYQRLPHGIDTLPIWVLVGYEWAGEYEGSVFQVGGAFELPHLSIAPSFERYFELEPTTATFARLDTAKLALRGNFEYLTWGLSLEAISIHNGGSLYTATPELGVRYKGVGLVGSFRAADARDVMFPAQRFSLALEWVPET